MGKRKKKAAAKKAAKPAKPDAKPAKKKSGADVRALHDRFAKFADKAEKAYGGSTAIAARIAETNMRLPRISTGNIGLDIAMFGGVPRARITRFFGREKSAKTGSCLNTVATWQHEHCGLCYAKGPCEHGRISGEDRPKPAALWIDAENRLADMLDWVVGHGVDLERLLIQSPPSGQHIVDFVDDTVQEKGTGIGLIVVDSVANITSQEERDKATMKGRTAPVNALLINKACRKWTASVCELGIADQQKPTILLINQIRYTMDAFGSPEVMPGGKAQDYATSIDVRFSSGKEHYLIQNDKGEWEDKTTGFSSRFKPPPDAVPDYVEVNYRVTASGICPNGRYGSFNYWKREAHGRRKGDPDNTEKLWEIARRHDMIQKNGRSYTLFGASASTHNALKELLYEDYGLQARLWRAVVAKLVDEKPETAE